MNRPVLSLVALLLMPLLPSCTTTTRSTAEPPAFEAARAITPAAVSDGAAPVVVGDRADPRFHAAHNPDADPLAATLFATSGGSESAPLSADGRAPGPLLAMGPAAPWPAGGFAPDEPLPPLHPAGGEGEHKI